MRQGLQLSVTRAASSYCTCWARGQKPRSWKIYTRRQAEGGVQVSPHSAWGRKAQAMLWLGEQDKPLKAPVCPRIKSELSSVACRILHPLLPANLIIISYQLQWTPC